MYLSLFLCVVCSEILFVRQDCGDKLFPFLLVLEVLYFTINYTSELFLGIVLWLGFFFSFRTWPASLHPLSTYSISDEKSACQSTLISFDGNLAFFSWTFWDLLFMCYFRKFGYNESWWGSYLAQCFWCSICYLYFNLNI